MARNGLKDLGAQLGILSRQTRRSRQAMQHGQGTVHMGNIDAVLVDLAPQLLWAELLVPIVQQASSLGLKLIDTETLRQPQGGGRHAEGVLEALAPKPLGHVVAQARHKSGLLRGIEGVGGAITFIPRRCLRSSLVVF